jgi:hypothetical protein
MSEIKQTALRLLELREKSSKVFNLKAQIDFANEVDLHIESIIKWALEMEEMVKKQTKSMQELVVSIDKLRYQRDKWVYECTISERINSSMYEKRVKELDLELESVGK